MVNWKFQFEKELKLTLVYKVVTIATVTLVLLAIFFVNYILTAELNSVEKYLAQSVLQTSSNLKGRNSSSISEVKVLTSKLVGALNSFSEPEVINFLTAHVTDYDYTKLMFIYPSGYVIKAQKKANLSHPIITKETNARYMKLFEENLPHVATRKDQTYPSGYANEFATPVYKNGKVVGYLGVEVDASTYIKILNVNNYDEKANTYIIDSEGNYLIKSQNDTTQYTNVFDIGASYVGATKDEVEKLLKTRNNDVFSYKINRKVYLAGFAIIDGANSYVLTSLPLDVLMLHTNKLLAGITTIIIIISMLLLTLLYYSSRLFKQNEEAIHEIAFTDKITGGGNENKFKLQAADILSSNTDSKYAVISMEIAKFKAISELYGTSHANQILKDVYEIINRNLTEGSVCVREYVATFLVLYKYSKENFIVKYFIDKVADEISLYNDDEMHQTSDDSNMVLSTKLVPSFGVYLIPNDSVTIEQACERAHIARNSNKGSVLKNCQFYDDTIRAQILQDKAVEDEMHFALNNGQFHMYLQPKVNLNTKELAGAEALVRWIHPKKGLVPPMSFIPLFEKNGFVVELDRCIWRQACQLLSERKEQGLKLFPISVNVSRLHLNNDAFIGELLLLTEKYDLDPEYLELELTESACFDNEKRFEETVKKLKRLGFTVAMDDFGTGYSSLNMLRELPIDVLKLDRGFIKDTITNVRGQIVTQSIISMANKLNMVTVAEGIEMEEQAEFLKQSGCQIAQGYLYGKPMDVPQFVGTFLASDTIAKKIN